MADEDGGALDIHGIMRFLRHRHPFLLLDRVLECRPGKFIRAEKNVSINEPFFPGHFPGYPVMPGVLVIEALAQAAAILTYRSTGIAPGGDAMFFFAGIDGARFRRQVKPGDRLTLNVDVIRIVRGVGKFTARALVDEELAAEAELMAVLRYTGVAGDEGSPSA